MNRKKILIVDDSAIILRALSMKLKASGYDVLTAVDGSEAVAAARQQKPDLILLDINFPPDVGHGGGVPWDGFLIMDWLRRIEGAKSIPVIVITGGDPAKLKDRALALGAVSFFQKPVDNDKLLAVIHQTLGEDTPPAAPV
jgi:CheY-like chemotaxis protein